MQDKPHKLMHRCGPLAPSVRLGVQLGVPLAVLLSAALLIFAAGPSRAQAAPAGAWELAGRQGLIQVVIVPAAQARSRDAYARQLTLLCAPQATCFVNFFTNSTGAAVSVPLPDAIEKEPTAIFRRSAKQGAELFRWSCRMGTDEGNCF